MNDGSTPYPNKATVEHLYAVKELKDIVQIAEEGQEESRVSPVEDSCKKLIPHILPQRDVRLDPRPQQAEQLSASMICSPSVFASPSTAGRNQR
jgi:hypothetical protein